MDTLKEKKIRFSETAVRQEMLFLLLRRDLTSYKVGALESLVYRYIMIFSHFSLLVYEKWFCLNLALPSSATQHLDYDQCSKVVSE